MEWSEAVLWLAGLCGAAVTIGSFFGRLTSPLRVLSDRVEALEKKVDKNERNLVSDLASFETQEKVNRLMLESLTLLLQHGATGNHNDDMAHMAERVHQYIYDKGGKLK